jgi:hypothetical protein
MAERKGGSKKNPVLHIIQKDKDPIDLELTPGASTIGRVKANSVTITGDTAISRQHCKFERVPEGVFVSDMGSSNGTKVNGKPIGTDRVPIKDGDKVQIGSTVATLDFPQPKKESRRGPPPPAKGAVARSDGTVFGDGFVKCGRCGNKISSKKKDPGQKVGCARCRVVYTLPDV